MSRILTVVIQDFPDLWSVWKPCHVSGKLAKAALSKAALSFREVGFRNFSFSNDYQLNTSPKAPTTLLKA